jgi:hypothetical protein
MMTIEPVVHDRPHSAPARVPRPAEGPTLFRFPFQRRYGGVYSNRHDKFVLREEHIVELKRLVVEHNRERPGRTEPLSASDILNCALDFALEHPGAFLNHRRASSVELRDTLAHEVYRRALVHFMLHEFI